MIPIRNVGWTLGNDCPYRCRHCYSMSVRRKGKDLEAGVVDRIVEQLRGCGAEAINLGGNEPLFTNGVDPRRSLLPYVVERLAEAGLRVGLTTAGITLVYLEKHRPDIVARFNDVDVSFDSPFEEEHNRNRGADLYGIAVRALEIARERGIPRSIVLCGMSWNFLPEHLRGLVELARRYEAHVRINPMKPVEPAHVAVSLPARQYFEGFSVLMELCDSLTVGEPTLGAPLAVKGTRGCPCGRASFRIHSPTPEGAIPVSPCPYMHDYAVGDLRVDELADILESPAFREFRARAEMPERIKGCLGCAHIEACRGGCAARSYLTYLHRAGVRSLLVPDPYCPRDQLNGTRLPACRLQDSGTRFVHDNYLCTWIGKPREAST